MSNNPNMVVVRYAEIFVSPRNSAPQTLTPNAALAPSTTTFAITPTEALLLSGLQHFVCVTPSVATLNYGVSEAAVMSRIQSITATGTFVTVVVSPALPGIPTAGTATVSIPWRCLGGTDGGIAINIDPSTTSHFIDQVNYAVLVTTNQTDVSVTAPLAEISPSNLALALGISPPAAGVTYMQIGANALTPRTDRVLVIGKGTILARRLWVFYNAINEGAVALNNMKDQKSIINLEFKIFMDSIGGIPVLGETVEAA